MPGKKLRPDCPQQLCKAQSLSRLVFCGFTSKMTFMVTLFVSPLNCEPLGFIFGFPNPLARHGLGSGHRAVNSGG